MRLSVRAKENKQQRGAYVRKSLDSRTLDRDDEGGRSRSPFIEAQIRIIRGDEETDDGNTADVEK